MTDSKSIIQKALNYLLICFVIFLYSFGNLYGSFVTRNVEQNDISFIKYDHNCTTSIDDLKSSSENIETIKNFNLSPYELNFFEDMTLVRCFGKVMSVEVLDNIVYAGIGTSTLFFSLLTLLYLYLTFRESKVFHKFLYLLNALLIAIFFRQDLSINEHVSEIIPILTLAILLNILNGQKIEKISNSRLYLSKLDSIRAFAVIIVLINHFNEKILPNGYLGVDIFFVISGYVITSSLMNLEKDKFLSFFKVFIYRRFTRIYPVLIFIISIFLVAINFYDLNVKNTFFTGLSAIFAVSNIFLFIESNEYFSDISSYNSFLHTWSLGIEEQFYLFYPAVFYLFHKNKNKLLISLAALTFVSIFLFIQQYDSSFLAAYYLPQYRIWEISFGALVFLLPKFKNSTIQTLNLLTLIAIVSYSTENTAYLHIGIVLSTSVFIIFYESKTIFNKILESKLLLKIGLLSYSIYLWHLPIGIMFKWVENNINIFNYLSIVLLLSFLTYKYIEIPNRKIFKLTKWKLIFITSITTSIFLINPLNESELESVNLENKSIEATFRYIPCHAPTFIGDIEECFTSKKQSEVKNIYMLGDSHISNHYFPLLEVLPSKDYAVELFVDFGYINYLVTGEKNCGDKPCLDNGTNEINNFLISNLDENDIVVFSVARDRFAIGEKLPRNVDFKKLSNLDEVIKKIIEDIIIPTESQLLLIDDIPKPCNDKSINWYKDVVELGNTNICYVGVQESKKDREMLSNILLSFSSEYKDFVQYFDPHDYLCFNNTCNIIEENILLYADLSPHLTLDANIYLELFWNDVLVTINKN